MKKIILYHPKTKHEDFYSFFWIPYSLLVVSSLIYKKYEVLIIDENLKEISNTYLNGIKNDILCVGISSMIGKQIEGGLNFAERIREINPSIPLIWGGHLPTILPKLTLNSEFVDIIVLGKGEQIFKELVDHLANKKSIEKINGIGFKKENKIIINNKLTKNKSYDLPPFPWHLIDVKKYIRDDDSIGEKVINYISSLGCTFPCTFCSEKAMFGNSWVSFKTLRIINDIQFLIDNYNVDSIKFYDANFFGKKKHVFDFIDSLNKNAININWAASGHPLTLNSLNQSDFDLFHSSCCKRLLIGAESGNQESLNLVKKNITPKTIIELSKKLKKASITGSFTFIVGFPGIDIDKEIKLTIELADRIKNISSLHEIKIHFFAPFPGTELYKKAIKYGFKPPKTLQEWANYNYYNIETPWADSKYQKYIHNYNKNSCKYVNL